MNLHSFGLVASLVNTPSKRPPYATVEKHCATWKKTGSDILNKKGQTTAFNNTGVYL